MPLVRINYPFLKIGFNFATSDNNFAMRKETEIHPEVLIIDDFHPLLMEGLSMLNITFDYNPEIEKDEILKRIEGYRGLIVRSKIECDKSFFEKAKQLKWIAKGGSGVNSIDEEEAQYKNIKIINAPEGNKNAVAEHTLGMILGLSNNIVRSYSGVKNYRWNREANRGIELEGKTIGIIGFGNIGSTLAKRLSGFDMRVLAYDKYKPIQSPFAIESSLEEIFEEADWVSLHVPLTEETCGMVNSSFLLNFKKCIGLINASRGKVVNANDVLEFLKLGKIFAFGADVLENEKPKNWSNSERLVYDNLMRMQNVIITPHIAGWTKESYKKISETLISKLSMEYLDKVR